MRVLIRHLVMWLLALALPWQGAAAATGLHCTHARSAIAAPGTRFDANATCELLRRFARAVGASDGNVSVSILL